MNMQDGRERAAEILRGSDGEKIYLELVDYADWLARLHGWKVDMTLPRSESPPSIVSEVFVKVLNGTRNWDPGKEPSLMNALKGMVRSEIGHLFKTRESHLVESANKPLPDGNERTADSFQSSMFTPAGLNPEEKLLHKERTELEFTAMTMILEAVTGSSELESVFLALYETDRASEIAEKTGLAIERVYSLKRELERIASKITPARVIAVRKGAKRE